MVKWLNNKGSELQRCAEAEIGAVAVTAPWREPWQPWWVAALD